jgi:hypothetical protein
MSLLKDSLLMQLSHIEKISAKELNKIANKNYKYLPSSDDEFMTICDEFIMTRDWHLLI